MSKVLGDVFKQDTAFDETFGVAEAIHFGDRSCDEAGEMGL